jgi:hypothetical protein
MLAGLWWGNLHKRRQLKKKTRRRWEGNIESGLEEIILANVRWIQLAKYSDRRRAVVYMVMNFQVQ